MTTVEPAGQRMGIQRVAVIAIAIVAIVIGVIALLWSGPTLATIGFLFGLFLLLSGVQRLVRAISARRVLGWWLWLNVAAGILLIVGGILSLTDPANSVVFLAVIIGIGWIIGGVVDLVGAANAGKRRGRWLVVLGGLLSIVSGAALLFVPSVTVDAFLRIGAVLLIVVGIGALLGIPRPGKRA